MKLKKLFRLLLIIPALLTGFVYGSGFITQFIRNYIVWQEAGGTAGDGTSPVFPSSSLIECLKALLNFPYGLCGIFICMTLFSLLILLVMKMGSGEKGEYDRERNLILSDKGTYGTAGFMTDNERDKVLETVSNVKSTRGIILGRVDNKVICLPEKTRMNSNVAVYGASGSMKSRAYCRNLVFTSVKRGQSIFLVDPKSELYEDMSQYLRDNSYCVRVFNLIQPEHSDSWNCLAEIEGDELMAQIFSDVIIKNTGSLKGDHFWDNAELNLLKALVIYVEQGYPSKSKNMGEVYKLLTLKSEKELNALFDILPITHPAKAPYTIFRQAADSIRGGVIIGLGSRLQIFQNKMICEITRHDEIDLELPGKQKCAYFVITSDQDSTFDFLVSLFFSFVFIKLVRYADKHGKHGVLPVPVHIIGDEWTNAAGAVFDFCKKISTIRSRSISISVIFQNIAQLKNRYPNDQWQEILGNCSTQLFLGATDELTATYVSSRSGDASINVTSKAKMLGTWRISDYTPEYRETSSVGKRKLLTVDECLRLPIDEALVILQGQKILKVQKFDYSLHPESKKLKLVKASEHIPDWHSKNNSADKESLSKITQQTSKVNKKPNQIIKGSSDTSNLQVTPEDPVSVIPADKQSILS